MLATDLAANRLILDDTCSLLVPPEPGAFAAGAVRLLADDGLREQLARRGREAIDTTYNFSAYKQRLAACYRQLLGTEEDASRGAAT